MVSSCFRYRVRADLQDVCHSRIFRDRVGDVAYVPHAVLFFMNAGAEPRPLKQALQ